LRHAAKGYAIACAPTSAARDGSPVSASTIPHHAVRHSTVPASSTNVTNGIDFETTSLTFRIEADYLSADFTHLKKAEPAKDHALLLTVISITSLIYASKNTTPCTSRLFLNALAKEWIHGYNVGDETCFQHVRSDCRATA
jgi:hypothetical protein